MGTSADSILTVSVKSHCTTVRSTYCHLIDFSKTLRHGSGLGQQADRLLRVLLRFDKPANKP